MKKILFQLFVCLFVVCAKSYASTAGVDVDAVLKRLDSCLEQSKTYDAQKEQRIGLLKQQLAAGGNGEKNYITAFALYEEYSSYQYDSAFVYATRAIDLAQQLGHAEHLVEASCALVFCQSSAGFYKEAFDTFEAIPFSASMSNDCRRIYYETAARLYYDVSEYTYTTPYQHGYIDRANAYTDSLLTLLTPATIPWLMATGRKEIKSGQFDACQTTFGKLLTMPHLGEHDRAIALSTLGWMKWQQGQIEEGMVDLAEAAMSDVRSSTKETTALRMLAELLYNGNDVHRATQYVQLALQSANFYGAQQRKVQVGSILPIIENERSQILIRQRNTMIAVAIVGIIVAIVIAYLLVFAVKRSRRLKEANRQIEKSKALMAETNEQLVEANKIKEEYIGNSLYINSLLMEQMKKTLQAVKNKIATKQYKDLGEVLEEATLKKERDALYSNFDETFLKIFPTFVDEYNALFPAEEQKSLAAGEPMPAEMRIFALIRLGITDTERIARFLDKSVHTIHNYKSRVKNKSVVNNEDFENRIMMIGKQ